MPEATLFPMPKPTENRPAAVRGEKPRVQAADRSQMEFRMMDVDSLVPPDHGVRSIWAFVEGMDLSALYAKIRAVEGNVGRSPIDPKIMLALWIYATTEGVGSARALDELCESHAAYQWIRGGVGVNYHSLSDFRTEHDEILSHLLTESVAAMMSKGLVDLKRVAQDGMRVRANAGAASFRREKKLKECQEEANYQVEALRQELNDDPGASKRREQAARMRAARERQERVEDALRQLPEVQDKKKTAEQKSEARVSTTDADARVMKMGDGGLRASITGSPCGTCSTQRASNGWA